MLPLKERILGFLGRMLSVVLGIVITFTVQGILDRKRDKLSVRSALELVRTELNSNLEDIGLLSDYFRQEKASAHYLAVPKRQLAKLPADSVNYHLGIINADVSVAFSHDALELLKMSSLFPKIQDNDLSMKIIRAYDSCDLLVSDVNRHVATRNSMGDKAVEWIISREDDVIMFSDSTDVKGDVEADVLKAVKAIDAFLLVNNLNVMPGRAGHKKPN